MHIALDYFNMTCAVVLSVHKNQMNPEATQEFQQLSEAYHAIMSLGIVFSRLACIGRFISILC